MIAFGPVPSRRLGQSLGIHHVPLKVRSYACLYCQVGPTLQMRVGRQAFRSSAEIIEAVTRRGETFLVRQAPGAGPRTSRRARRIST
jgi:wyosine [tRNA(Phe)-imidazoG37] synthetase (radical SAM superfamily)